jgi:hypothetical protein
MGVIKLKEERDYEPLKQLARMRDAKPKKESGAKN